MLVSLYTMSCLCVYVVCLYKLMCKGNSYTFTDIYNWTDWNGLWRGVHKKNTEHTLSGTKYLRVHCVRLLVWCSVGHGSWTSPCLGESEKKWQQWMWTSFGNLVKLENFDYQNKMMGCILRESFHEVNFTGITVSEAVHKMKTVLYMTV